MSDNGVVRDPYDSRVTGKLTGPDAGPYQQRGFLRLAKSLGSMIGDEPQQLAAMEADLAARAPTAAPRVGQAGMGKIDPQMMSALIELLRAKEARDPIWGADSPMSAGLPSDLGSWGLPVPLNKFGGRR